MAVGRSERVKIADAAGPRQRLLRLRPWHNSQSENPSCAAASLDSNRERACIQPRPLPTSTVSCRRLPTEHARRRDQGSNSSAFSSRADHPAGRVSLGGAPTKTVPSASYAAARPTADRRECRILPDRFVKPGNLFVDLRPVVAFDGQTLEIALIYFRRNRTGGDEPGALFACDGNLHFLCDGFVRPRSSSVRASPSSRS